MWSTESKHINVVTLQTATKQISIKQKIKHKLTETDSKTTNATISINNKQAMLSQENHTMPCYVYFYLHSMSFQLLFTLVTLWLLITEPEYLTKS